MTEVENVTTIRVKHEGLLYEHRTTGNGWHGVEFGSDLHKELNVLALEVANHDLEKGDPFVLRWVEGKIVGLKVEGCDPRFFTDSAIFE